MFVRINLFMCCPFGVNSIALLIVIFTRCFESFDLAIISVRLTVSILVCLAAVDDEEVEDLNGPLEDQEIKDGQWMGVTVRSSGQGGKVLVCAHRYITKISDSQHGQGLCYVLSNDLKYDETYEPCKGRSVVRQHEDYGFCQAGTSGAMLDDGTMIIGTPGPITWRGTIFVISVDGEYLKRDKNHYYGPHSEQTSPVDKYSYLGKEY